MAREDHSFRACESSGSVVAEDVVDTATSGRWPTVHTAQMVLTLTLMNVHALHVHSCNKRQGRQEHNTRRAHGDWISRRIFESSGQDLSPGLVHAMQNQAHSATGGVFPIGICSL